MGIRNPILRRRPPHTVTRTTLRHPLRRLPLLTVTTFTRHPPPTVTIAVPLIRATKRILNRVPSKAL